MLEAKGQAGNNVRMRLVGCRGLGVKCSNFEGCKSIFFAAYAVEK